MSPAEAQQLDEADPLTLLPLGADDHRDARFAVGQQAPPRRQVLSLQHPARHSTPDAPSNEERFRAYRNMLPAMPGNNYAWAFRFTDPHSTSEDAGIFASRS